MRQRPLVFNVAGEAAMSGAALYGSSALASARATGEIPERPDSIDRPLSRSKTIVGQQFVILHHGRLLQTEDSRRNSATDNGGQHNGDINPRFFVESDPINPGPAAGDPHTQNQNRDTLDPANQTSDHAFQRLTQPILPNSFNTTTTIQPMA
jgi:hypothetical protein